MIYTLDLTSVLVLRNLHNYTPVFKEIITIDDMSVSFKFTVQKMLSEIVNKGSIHCQQGNTYNNKNTSVYLRSTT